MIGEQPTEAWYKQTWVVVVALLLFFPVGLYLMWRFTRWEVWVKAVVSVAVSLLAIIIVAAAAAGGDDDNDKQVSAPDATPSPTVDVEATQTARAAEAAVATATTEAEAIDATATADALAPAATATAEAFSLAATATAEAEQQAAVGLSRDNPVPAGQALTVPDGWEISVVNFIPDATQMVLAENQFNDPPDPGFKYVIVRVRATNVSAGDPADFDASFALRLVGSRSVSYDQFTRSCGVIPDELGLDVPSEAFTGGTVEGNICFHVGADEAEFVMFTEFFLGESTTYFAVQ